MAVFSIIQKSQLEGANRLDAEYYQPEYLAFTDRLNRLKPQPLSSLVDKLDVGFVSSMKDQFQDSGVPLLRTQNVKEFFVDLESDVVYVDEDFHSRSKKTQIYPGYVLLARSGSIGAACVVPKNFGLANSADIILIKPSENFDPYFLAAFINSKYGRFQIERGISGGIQGHINLYTLEQLQIPNLAPHTQGIVRSVVEAGLEQLDQSKSLYSRAEQMLLEELGLAEESFADELCYVVDYSKMTEAERIDADYFQPKYKKLFSKLKTQNTKPLGEIAKRRAEKIKTLSEDTYNYIEISNINVSDGEVGFMKMLDSELPTNAKIKINSGELLISKVRPTRGAVTVIPSDWGKNYIASGAFSVFVTQSPMREYLQIVLRSVVGKVQLGRPTTGTSYPTITDGDVEKLLIPILSQPTQQKIAGLVRQSHQARKKSKELLEEAKRKVEGMIEKGISPGGEKGLKASQSGPGCLKNLLQLTQ